MTSQKCRLLFDSMVWDEVILNSGLLSALEDARDLGLIEIWRTQVQVDQNEKMSDEKKLVTIVEHRKKFAEREILTAGVVLDVSRLGGARLGEQKDNELFAALMGNNTQNAKHGADALIGTTAVNQNMILVTGDKPYYKKMESLGTAVIRLENLQECLESWRPQP